MNKLEIKTKINLFISTRIQITRYLVLKVTPSKTTVTPIQIV